MWQQWFWIARAALEHGDRDRATAIIHLLRGKQPWTLLSLPAVAVGPERWPLRSGIVHARAKGDVGSLYRSQHELVFVYKSGRAPHINNVELGAHGRYRTNVWPYAGVNSLGASRDADLAMHPTVKPVALVADAILDCSRRKGIALDALYCDIIVRRLAKIAGVEAVHAETGQTFEVVATERSIHRPWSPSGWRSSDCR